VQVGQEVELKVIRLDDDKEKLILSKRAADGEKSVDLFAVQNGKR